MERDASKPGVNPNSIKRRVAYVTVTSLMILSFLWMLGEKDNSGKHGDADDDGDYNDDGGYNGDYDDDGIYDDDDDYDDDDGNNDNVDDDDDDDDDVDNHAIHVASTKVENTSPRQRVDDDDRNDDVSDCFANPHVYKAPEDQKNINIFSK